MYLLYLLSIGRLKHREVATGSSCGPKLMCDFENCKNFVQEENNILTHLAKVFVKHLKKKLLQNDLHLGLEIAVFGYCFLY